MIYSLFCRHNCFEFFLYSILGQQLLFKRKHRGVVSIHGHAYRKVRVKLKREVSRTEKGSRLRLLVCFRVVKTFLRRKEWICESRCQVSVHLHVFAGLFCP